MYALVPQAAGVARCRVYHKVQARAIVAEKSQWRYYSFDHEPLMPREAQQGCVHVYHKVKARAIVAGKSAVAVLEFWP